MSSLSVLRGRGSSGTSGGSWERGEWLAVRGQRDRRLCTRDQCIGVHKKGKRIFCWFFRRAKPQAMGDAGVMVSACERFCRETCFWRHNSLFSDLRRGASQDRLGAIELTFSRVGVRFCRHVYSHWRTDGDAPACRGMERPGRRQSAVDLEESTNRSGVWFQGFWNPATGAGAPF